MGQKGNPVKIISERGCVTFLDTGNSCGASQRNYGAAFRVLNLIPVQQRYQAALQSGLFVSTKTGLRSCIVRDGGSVAGFPGVGKPVRAGRTETIDDRDVRRRPRRIPDSARAVAPPYPLKSAADFAQS